VRTPHHKHTRFKLFRDTLIVVVSVAFAILIVQIGAFDHIVSDNHQFQALASFITGLFFTSVFTIAPASVAIAKLSQVVPTPLLALWAGLGAMIGDLILFLFIRDSLADDILELVKGPEYRKIIHIFRLRMFRWLIPLVGALLIISPLPDELGLAMMGFSKVRTIYMIPITFILNFVGVLLIVGFAHIL
jgi:hypothetical protein